MEIKILIASYIVNMIYQCGFIYVASIENGLTVQADMLARGLTHARAQVAS